MRPDWAKGLDRVGGSLLGRALGALDRLAEVTQRRPVVDDVRRILVIKLWGLGNWALLRPTVADLKARWPGARVTIVTLPVNRPLVEDLADDLLLVHHRSLHRVARDLARAVAWLRRERHDLAVDFEQFARTGALLARLGRVTQRIGFRSGDRGRDGLYTVTVPFRPDDHAARSFRDLAEAAGVPPGPAPLGGLVPSAAGRRAVAQHLAGGPVVVLHPGSGDNFPGRRWSPQGFAAVGRAAVLSGCRVLVTGAPAEAALAADVAGRIGDGARAVAGELSVEELIALLAGAEALVSNDTGPVHLASQLGTPVLALYGPNTPVLYGPRSPGSRAFYRALPCSPCLTTANYRSSRCRIHTCMAAIATGEVVQALTRLLDARTPRAGAAR